METLKTALRMGRIDRNEWSNLYLAGRKAGSNRGINYISAKSCPGGNRICRATSRQAAGIHLVPNLLEKWHGGLEMHLLKQTKALQAGKVGWILLWALGIPIPVLLILFLLRGCT